MRKRQGMQLFVVLVVLIASVSCDEDDAKKFLDDINDKYVTKANSQKLDNWIYENEIKPENIDSKVASDVKFQNFQKETWKDLGNFDWNNFEDDMTKREFEMLYRFTNTSLGEDDDSKLNNYTAQMEAIYSIAQIRINGSDFPLYPGVIAVMANSENYDELKDAWKNWRDKTGKQMSQHYAGLVHLTNEAASMNGFNDTGSFVNARYLYDEYSEEAFKDDLEHMYQAILPLYKELFTYVRRIMSGHIYKSSVDRYGDLPAHILGTIEADSWGNIIERVMPYKSAPFKATKGMVDKNVTVDEMFQKSEQFFVDLGLEKMTDKFKKESKKMKESEVQVCHPSAEDFYTTDDYRMRMCTTITQEDLVTIHQKMSQIQYFMGYQKQHWTFRSAANPGFYEAIGGAMGLAVATPAHLQSLGYLSSTVPDNEDSKRFEDLPDLPKGMTAQDMNYLLSQALDKIAFIPFAYSVNQWRWSVYNGSKDSDNFNSEWWAMRHKFQGVKPPTDRTHEDFDAGSIFEIAADVEYVQYFVGSFLQFQFYKSMCDEADGKPDLLFKCDFSGNHKVGDKMRTLFNVGSSQSWPDVLKEMTGNTTIDAEALLEYFKPLHSWLEEANKMANDCIGWEGPCSQPPYDNTVPIVVGVVLVVLVLLVIVAYFIGRSRSRKVQNVTATTEEGRAQ